jgi:hypothetical protein
MAGGQNAQKLPEFCAGYNHENDGHSLRETPGSLDPGHPISEGREFGDEWLGIGRGNEPDNHIPKGNHGLDLHADQGPEAVSGKIGKQVPVIPKVGYDYARREQPDTGFCNTDPTGEVCMPPVDIDRPDRFKAGLYDPCDQDKDW